MQGSKGGNYSQYVDTEEGWIDRRIFWDRDIYDAELENVFARSWLYVGHESQIAKPGDFLTTYMGEDSVILSRKKDGGIAVFINSCPHRGNRVCFADAGNTRQFICNYHGWSFGNGGELLGMHEEYIYKECSKNFDKEKLSLPPARVDTYKGLIFATFDPDAPDLLDYMGDFAWYLDMLVDNDEGGTEVIGGAVRNVLNCNWKFPAENFHGDAYHVGWNHLAGSMAFGGQGFKADQTKSFQMNSNGHGWETAVGGGAMITAHNSGPVLEYALANIPKIEQRLGKERAEIYGSISSVTMFPNFSFLPGLNTIRVWRPKGPTKTEIWAWVLVNKNAPDEVKRDMRKGVMRTFSPSGMLEMDDGENWENATLSNKGAVTRRQKLHYGMNLNAPPGPDYLPGNVHMGQIGDNNQLAMYQRWADLMDAPSWADVPDRRKPKKAAE